MSTTSLKPISVARVTPRRLSRHTRELRVELEMGRRCERRSDDTDAGAHLHTDHQYQEVGPLLSGISRVGSVAEDTVWVAAFRSDAPDVFRSPPALVAQSFECPFVDD